MTRDGARIFYEVYGDGEDTILFLPAWQHTARVAGVALLLLGAVVLAGA